jgi:hypothetical protein
MSGGDGAALASHIGEADRSGEDEVEKAVEASRGAAAHKTEGGMGRLGLNPNAVPLYTPRLELNRAWPACQIGWASTGQATMPWAGPLLSRRQEGMGLFAITVFSIFSIIFLFFPCRPD